MNTLISPNSDARQPDGRHLVEDVRFGALGFVVIDSTVNGSATGGIRTVETLDGVDVEALARVMTRKYSLLPFPRNGGAKGAVVIPRDATRQERVARLHALGRELGPLIRTGSYLPWTDLRTDAEDIETVYRAAGRTPPELGDTGIYTAYSVAGAGLAACDILKLRPTETRAVIQGLGSVGAELAATLDRIGMRVIAAASSLGCLRAKDGLNLPGILARRKEIGDGWAREPECGNADGPPLPAEDILNIECDLFFPCAQENAIDRHVARTLPARAVVPAANEVGGPGAEEELARRGVLFLPDFLVNAGGILGSFLAGFGIPRKRLEEFELEVYRRLVHRLVARAEAACETPYRHACSVADARYEERARSSWCVRKIHGALYRLLRAPRLARRLAGEVFLVAAGRSLNRRFTES